MTPEYFDQANVVLEQPDSWDEWLDGKRHG